MSNETGEKEKEQNVNFAQWPPPSKTKGCANKLWINGDRQLASKEAK